MGMGVRVSSCNTTGFSSIQTTGSVVDNGLSYNPSTSSMRAMYSSSNFATHHIFFPPRLQIVAFEQHSYGLPPCAWNQLAPDRLFGQQTYGPACPSLRRRRAGHRDDALPLFLIQRGSLARTRAMEQRTIQTALPVALGDLPHRLGRKPEADSHRRGGLSIIHLPQRQRSQYRPHRLQTATQQLIQLLAITPGKLQTQSSAHALVIRPHTTPAKYLPRLLIYAVIALGRVVGVDVDVFGGQVAGEEAGGGVAFAQVDGNGVFGLHHGGVGGGFVEGAGARAIFEDGLSADPDAGAVRREDCAAIAGGREQPAPVGIA